MTTSMREIIAAKNEVTTNDLVDHDLARVEQFTFIKVKSGWLFNRAYYEE